MAMASFSVRVLDQCQISPPRSTDSRHPLDLTFFDIMWMCNGAVSRLFFYDHPHPIADFTASVLPPLKSSLSATLHHFYPLAGRFRRSAEDNTKFQLRYSDGDFVPFTVTECTDGDFTDVSGYHDRSPSKLQPLVSHLHVGFSDADPLLAVQVTVFPNKGFVVGVKISHVACDGRSFMHFVRSWAATCRGEPSVEPLPSFDRTIVSIPETLSVASPDDVKEYYDSIPDAPKPATPSEPIVMRSFKFGKRDIEKLKQRVPFRSSSFMVACACAWVSLLKARGAYYTGGEKRTKLIFPADSRERLNPPKSPAYFGNCIRPCFTDAVEGDLLGEDGLVVACEAIGRAIKELEGGVFNGWEKWRENFASAEKPMAVAGSPKFGAYGVDFGWGRPVKVDLAGLVECLGVISLSENRDEEGGVELGISLVESEMNVFSSSVSDAVNRGC
ncbi:hypothetical protein J5N97_021695 [Dioscorea zingiberensis]|uniref:Uncharacterized protein n=1 Tax=Dioscorea zingiberensis TaxID=325984 RepID=A0A9D5C9B1_9LILI|nr:hypothetical protein J5N97_021695 [Dioscorea zingiberensis]